MVDVSSAGVVPGDAELVSKKTEVVGEPSVENWSWVVPLTVWNTFEFAPPLVRPRRSAVAPVASAEPPNTTPRPCDAAPPMRPCMTLPSPRLILGLIDVLPNRDRVETRLNVMSPVSDERSVTSILLAPKLPATSEEMLAVLILAVLMLRAVAYPLLVEM